MFVFKKKLDFLLAQFQYQEDLLLVLLLEKVIVIANGRKGIREKRATAKAFWFRATTQVFWFKY